MYGTWLYSYHTCRPSPTMTLPPRPVRIVGSYSLPILNCADKITPGEATRLCLLIRDELARHRRICEWCYMLEEQDLLCVDGILLRDALEHWNRYTLIEVDREVK